MRKYFFTALVFLSFACGAQNPWTIKAPFGGGPRAATVGFSIGHYGFIGCGTTVPIWSVSGDQDDFWKYDDRTNTWTQIANYGGGKMELGTGFSIEGKGYVCFGWNGAGMTALWQYDTTSNVWTQKATFPGVGRYDVSDFVIGHKVYIIAGSISGPPYLSDVWVYDAHQDTWKQLNNFPETNVEMVTAFSIGNHGYAGNGYNNPGCFKNMYEYDTTSDSWSLIAPIPYAYGISSNGGTCSVGSRGYVFSGDDCNTPGIQVGWMYDTVTKAWCAFTDMGISTEKRAFNVSFVIDNHIYMGTGYDTTFHNMGDFLEYTPSAKIGVKDSTICNGDSVNFSCTSTYLGNTWSWTFPGGSPSLSGLQNPVVTYTTSGTYTAELILNACGAIDTVYRTFTYTQLSLGGVTISGTFSICNGKADTLTANGGTSYKWSTGATTSSIIISPATTTIYTLQVSNGTCKIDTSVTVNVTPLPTITFSGNNSICKGDSTLISATGGGTYLWNTGATTSNITVKPAINATYSVSVNNGGCQKDSTTKVTVNLPPIITLSGKDTICDGNSTTLTASGGTSYLWNTTATTSSVTVKPTKDSVFTVHVSNGLCSKDTIIKVKVNPLPVVTISGNNILCKGDTTILIASGGISYKWSTGATTSSISVNPSSSTNYTIAISNGTCTKDTSISVTVNPLPNAKISGNNSICLGDSTILTASGGGTYKWSTNSTASSITVKPLSNTTYTVTVTSGTCSKDTTITISVNNLTASISKPDSICQGDSIKLSSNGGGTYSWSNGATTATITVTPPNTTTYSVTITNGGCKKDTSVRIKVNPLPKPVITGNSKLCKGDTTTLRASGGTSYTWEPSLQTGDTLVVNPFDSVIYTVIVTNIYGCKNDTTFHVNIVTPNGSVAGQSSICLGDSTTLTASGGGTYLWNTGATSKSILVKPTINTTYTVIVNNGCLDTVSTIVSVSSPNLIVCCDTTIFNLGTPVNLSASGTLTYIWSPTNGLSCTNCPNPIATPSVTTTYTVIGTDSAGCMIEKTLRIEVSECLDISTIPNVITPNDDKKNDAFIIATQNVSEYSIFIYDRWGKLEYKSNDQNVYWDGKNQNDNSLVPEGVYYYILKYSCNSKSYNKGKHTTKYILTGA